MVDFCDSRIKQYWATPKVYFPEITQMLSIVVWLHNHCNLAEISPFFSAYLPLNCHCKSNSKQGKACPFFMKGGSENPVKSREILKLLMMMKTFFPIILLLVVFINANTQNPVGQNVCMQARQESKLNYTGQNSGVGWVTATTIINSPLSGLISAVVISSAEPADHNLNYRNYELMPNKVYQSGQT